jgi:microcystin-dependent protein
MGTPYIGEIRMVAFSFAPKGWATCDGQAVQISQNQPLFSLLGTIFGGDGRVTFLLPDFRGRAPIEPGALSNTPTYVWGQPGGEELHVLAQTEMASHTHTATASSASNTLGTPSGNFWATGVNQYAASPINTALAPTAIANSGSGQGHENRSPYLVVNFIIALVGLFPSRT